MEPYLGEIRVFGFGIIPRGWASCNGAILSIAQNQALFSLLGTQYGGNGVTTFALPDLRGSAMTGQGSSAPVGMLGGTENVTLLQTQIPQHTHTFKAQTGKATGIVSTASSAILAEPVLNVSTDNFTSFIGTATGLTPLHPATITQTGGSQPHNNMPPFLTVNVCISLQGIFPSRN